MLPVLRPFLLRKPRSSAFRLMTTSTRAQVRHYCNVFTNKDLFSVKNSLRCFFLYFENISLDNSLFLADAETLMFTKQEEADMKQEMEAAAKMGNVKVKTWDEVITQIRYLDSSIDSIQLFEVLKVRAPKTYAALMKRREVWNKTIAKLDAPAQSFVKNVSILFQITKLVCYFHIL